MIPAQKTNSTKVEQWQICTAAMLLIASIAFCIDLNATPNRCAELLFTTPSGKSEAVKSTQEILGQLSVNSGKKNRPNPVQVEVEALRIGQDYYVTPGAFRGYPTLVKAIKEPIQMRVVQIFEGSIRRNFKNARKVIYFESPETGRIGIESWRLLGEIYSEKEFSHYSPFESGEYVQIGADYSSSNSYKTVKNPDHTFVFSGHAAAYIGKFVRIYDENNYVIQIQSIKDNVPPTEIIVPRYLTYGLTSGTASHFRNAVRGLLTINIAFKSGELVRYRRVDGTIGLGIFIRSNKNHITLKDEADQTVYISPQSVFRYIDGDPHTATYNADWIHAHFQKPTDLVRQFLDGAGKLTSLPDFAEQSPEQKILTLMKYLKANVNWTKGALSGETAGLRDFNEILCSGAGVCRHLAPLMATMLSELGYTPRVTKYIEQGKDGHAWLEVDVRDSYGQLKTFVVDPSNGEFVKAFSEVSAAASKNKNSSEAAWYIKPGREFLVVNPQ